MKDRVAGYRAAGVACGIKPSGKPDLALIVSERPAAAAGLFTRNRFPGAPVVVSRARMQRGRAQAIVVNSGVSNVATGQEGLRAAREMAAEAAQVAGIAPALVQVASTGVIGAPLPIEKVRKGIVEAAARLSPSGWTAAARAILTTDLKPKLAHAECGEFAILGLAKGSGMIMPDMATMLAFVVTDAAAEPEYLRRCLEDAAGPTLNSLTVDGETSTSDMLLLLANGARERPPLRPGSAPAKAFEAALGEVCRELADRIAADGEGVTRLAEIDVRGARSEVQARRVARKVANSMLFKTALFGSDPNWGRIVQAVGAAGVPLDPRALDIAIGGVPLLEKGEPTGGPAAIVRAERAMKRKRVHVEIRMGSGPGQARVLTTDLTYDYVRINAEYTT